MGPLALADLIGLDTCVAIMEVLERGLGEPRYAPCPLLREHVAAGPARPQVGRGLLPLRRRAAPPQLAPVAPAMPTGPRGSAASRIAR